MNQKETKRFESMLAECQRRLESVPGVTFIAQTERQGKPHVLVALAREDAALRKSVRDICGDAPLVIEVSGRIDAS